MKKILTLSAAGLLALSAAACTSPDDCIDDLECGTAPYSEERTYSAPVREESMSEPRYSASEEETMLEPLEPMEPMAPPPVEEPVQGTAEPMFDSRLTK